MEPRDKLAWGDGEDLETFLRRLDACRLAVGDEKKAVGKALLGLGSRIAVMDALSEADTKDVASLKKALRRELGHLRAGIRTGSISDVNKPPRGRGGWGELSGKESWHTAIYEEVCGLSNNYLPEPPSDTCQDCT